VQKGFAFHMSARRRRQRTAFLWCTIRLVGSGGWGPVIAYSRWHVALPDYLAQMDHTTVCMLLIEARAAVANIESIC
jgi:hypothetical protein